MDLFKSTDEALYMLLINHVPMILYAEGKWSDAAEVATLGKVGIKLHKHTRKLYESLTSNDEGKETLRELSAKYEKALKTLGIEDAA